MLASMAEREQARTIYSAKVQNFFVKSKVLPYGVLHYFRF